MTLPPKYTDTDLQYIFELDPQLPDNLNEQYFLRDIKNNTKIKWRVNHFLFKKKLAEARAAITGAKEKMAIYRQACIIKWAMIEGASLFSIICFLLTRNYAFLVLAAVLILLFAMMAPSKLKIIIQLQISEAEIETL